MSDLETPSCCSSSTPTARLRHRCCECWGVIEVGEKYAKLTGVWDGDALTYKTCSDCEALRHDLSKGVEEDIALSGIYERLTESGYLLGLERMKAICDRRGSWHLATRIKRHISNLKEETKP